MITWFTCDDASGANPQNCAVSRGNQPLKAYTLMPGDVGKFLRVSVEPKHQVSEPGPAVYAMAATRDRVIGYSIVHGFAKFSEFRGGSDQQACERGVVGRGRLDGGGGRQFDEWIWCSRGQECWVSSGWKFWFADGVKRRHHAGGGRRKFADVF